MSYRVSDEMARELGLPEQDRILYVLTVEDVEVVYEDKVSGEGLGWPDFWTLPVEEQEVVIHEAQGYIESALGDAEWYDAIYLALEDVAMPRCPHCGVLISNGEVSRFLEYTGYCWACYPNPKQLIDILMGDVHPDDIAHREELEVDNV